MPKGTFKFRSDTTQAERVEVENQLAKRGVMRVRPLFEAEHDPALSLLRVFESETSESHSSAVEFLKGHPLVEYAEGPIQRKPMRRRER